MNPPSPAPRRVTIRVDASAPGLPIGPDLFGAFFEDLNYAADGGLYAELVQNRSFEYSAADGDGCHALTAWEPVERGGARAAVTVATDDPPHRNNPHYAVLAVTAPRQQHTGPGGAGAGGAEGGLMNHGFDGIPVEAGARYIFSVFARCTAGAPGRLTVRLESAAGVPYGETTFDTPAGGWQRHEVTVESTGTDPAARLLLLATAPGTVHLDLVSLFPERTYRGRRNGLRDDLARTVADLRPRFLRFPGGCLAHGLGLDNMYRWKDTTGPLEQRRQQPNLWGYHQSNGLGYYEFFQFCEDIGAKPLPVVAAGVCCQNTPGGPAGIPLDDMDAYIQEVLDLVEYANGPATSRWGAERAAAGHPEPFGLEYLGVGNEDSQTPEFRERFALIHAALVRHHPEITVIGTVGPSPAGPDHEAGWSFARKLGLDMVDEHMYMSPRWLRQNTRRYDSYDRGGPKVYLGEWASKGNTLLNALAEALCMNALERNGDIVALASYAPLLARTGHTQWHPDLVHFDATEVWPTVNYHVQRMYACNQGDRYLPSTVTDPPPAGPAPDGLRGGVRLRTWRTEAEFAGLRVTGGDAVRCDEPRPEQDRSYGYGEVPFRTAEVRARKNAGDEGFLIDFGAVDTPDHYRWNLGGWRNRSMSLQRRADGFVEDLDQVPGTVETGRWYAIRIEIAGRTVRCFLDGALIHSYEDDPGAPECFSVSGVRDSASGDLIVKIVNLTPAGLTAGVELAGAGPLAPRAVRTVLSGELSDGAAGEPYRTPPTTSELPAGAVFDCPLPPNSLTVLRLGRA